MSQTLQPLSTQLEILRKWEIEGFDAPMLYTTVLNLLKDVKEDSTHGQHYGYDQLASCLFRCGFEYYDYAAVFAEQGLVRGGRIEHRYHCNLCPYDFAPNIRGSRFVCLDCISGDFCAECYANWEKSNGAMEYCKGHTFYEVPRPSWHTFKDGEVLGDGSKLPQVIDVLEQRFTSLLEGAKDESISKATVSCDVERPTTNDYPRTVHETLFNGF